MARHPENPSADSRIAAVAAEYSAERDFAALYAAAVALAVAAGSAAWLVVAVPTRRSALLLGS